MQVRLSLERQTREAYSVYLACRVCFEVANKSELDITERKNRTKAI
jgi:hypothetical protein